MDGAEGCVYVFDSDFKHPHILRGRRNKSIELTKGTHNYLVYDLTRSWMDYSHVFNRSLCVDKAGTF